MNADFQARRSRAVSSIKTLRAATAKMTPPASLSITAEYGQNPYLLLISCLLSLRTKDTTSLPASRRLFEHARTPQEMLALSLETIEKLIFPVGFYRRKAIGLQEISKEILVKFGGSVPNTLEGLMSLKGVGLKTANLVLAQGFGIPAICVDVHVHRISNRLGLVNTKTPEETEAALKELLPEEYLIEYGNLLVVWGQNVCVPVSPFCSTCPLQDSCQKIGVKKSR